VVSDRFDAFARVVGDIVSRHAGRRGLLRLGAGGVGVVGAILRGDLTSDAKPKRKQKRTKRKRWKKRQCSGTEDCTVPENPCETVVCKRHRCQIRNRPDGTPCGEERECRDGVCEVPCGGLCTGGRVCVDEECVCPERGVCVISPSWLDSWSLHTDEQVAFVEGPGTPPQGTGSVRLSTVDNHGSAFANDLFDSVPLAEISALNFATFVVDGDAEPAPAGVPSLEIHVLLSGGFDSATLVFAPENVVNTPILPDVWQAWEALGADARWLVEGGPDCEDGCVMSWTEVVAAFPGATIVGGLVIKSGSGASDAAGHLDGLMINGLTYDFEPDGP
jgi:hypothetical protein